MEIETLTILKLNQQEAAALKKLLGEHSHDSKLKMGLTSDEATMVSEIWDALPHPEEESA